MPRDRRLASLASNAAKPAARAAVDQFITDIAHVDGHPLPIRMRRSDVKLTDVLNDTVSVVVLPPTYTKRSLHKEHILKQDNNSFRVGIDTFIDVLLKDL